VARPPQEASGILAMVLKALRVLLPLCVFGAQPALAAEISRPAVADYLVQYRGGDEFRVDARFHQPASKLTLYFFPTKENPEGQAAFIKSLRAWDAKGRPEELKYLGEANWQGAAGPVGRIQYTVLARHDTASWGPGKDEVATHFDNSYFFAGNAFFLADYSWPDAPVRVRFDLPSGWHAITPWAGQGNILEAATRRKLTFNLFAISKDAAHVEQAGPVKLTWLADSRLKPVEPRLRELLVGLPAAYSNFWGSTPVDALTVFAFADPETDGGAFIDSFALRLATPFETIDRVAWPHWLGHELMHLWNGSGRIQVADDGSTYWFNEGVTDYLAVKLMHRTGLIDDALLKQRLANFARRYELGRKISPNVKFAAAGADKFKNWELIYGGGAMFGFLLDAELSKSDPQAFQHTMREVYRQADEPYDQQRLMRVLDGTTNGSASRILAWLDEGQTWSQLRERLRPVGVEFSGFGSDEAYVDFTPCGRGNCVPSFLQQQSVRE
jgi:predicted metalloprotease with PDZ domain